MAGASGPNSLGSISGEEEERRLFYVALTRAREQAVFSMARWRRRYGERIPQQPSRFLLEIDPKLFGPDAPSLSAPSKEKKAEKSESAPIPGWPR